MLWLSHRTLEVQFDSNIHRAPRYFCLSWILCLRLSIRFATWPPHFVETLDVMHVPHISQGCHSALIVNLLSLPSAHQKRKKYDNAGQTDSVPTDLIMMKIGKVHCERLAPVGRLGSNYWIAFFFFAIFVFSRIGYLNNFVAVSCRSLLYMSSWQILCVPSLGHWRVVIFRCLW